jgi:hypothetical protein
MSPPEVWGPAVWTLFHTLAEKINPDAYRYVIGSMFGIIVQICKVLPCPDCSRDASQFLAQIKLDDYKTKVDFKNLIYLFHNWVNAKKRKPLFNYANMYKYEHLNLTLVIKDFIAKYNTKGNMKLLTESFQRGFVVKNFISWFKTYSRAFVKPVIIKQLPIIVEEPVVEEPIVKEDIASVEENVINEENIFTQENVTTNAFEKNIVATIEEIVINEENSLNISSLEKINEENLNVDIIVSDNQELKTKKRGKKCNKK